MKRTLLIVCLGLAVIGAVGGFRAWHVRRHGPVPDPARFASASSTANEKVSAVPAAVLDSAKLSRSVVVPTLDSPMPEGKNVIWCATFQAAWDRLKDDVVAGPVQVANAEEAANRLNGSPIAVDDLPDESFYAAAGFIKDGIAEKIRAEMRERFQRQPTDLTASDDALLAYGYLQAAVPFAVPYLDYDKPTRFTDSQERGTEVTAFGIRPRDQSIYTDVRAQPEVLFSTAEHVFDTPAEFALDLCRDSTPNQVIVARVPHKATLLATVEDLEHKMAGYQTTKGPRRLVYNTILLVPKLDWRITHHFTELEGVDKRLLNSGFTEYFIHIALQTIDFRLDRGGVTMKSEAEVEPEKGPPGCYLLNGPFLIVVKKRDAQRPFFVMWIDNDELLCKPTERKLGRPEPRGTDPVGTEPQ